MACLRYLALCPCLRCLLLKSKIPLIGSKTDTKSRLQLVRKDNEARREKIEDARRLMFEKGDNITSEKIEKILRPHSLTPTRVSTLGYFLKNFKFKSLKFRMHSRSDCSNTDSISMKCLSLIYSMSLNLECSRLYFPTCFGLSMPAEGTKFRYSIIGEFDVYFTISLLMDLTDSVKSQHLEGLFDVFIQMFRP